MKVNQKPFKNVGSADKATGQKSAHLFKLSGVAIGSVLAILEAIEVAGEAVLISGRKSLDMLLPGIGWEEVRQVLQPLQEGLEICFTMGEDVLRRIPSRPAKGQFILGMKFSSQYYLVDTVVPVGYQPGLESVSFSVQQFVMDKDSEDGWLVEGQPKKLSTVKAVLDYTKSPAEHLTRALEDVVYEKMAIEWPDTYQFRALASDAKPILTRCRPENQQNLASRMLTLYNGHRFGTWCWKVQIMSGLKPYRLTRVDLRNGEWVDWKSHQSFNSLLDLVCAIYGIDDASQISNAKNKLAQESLKFYQRKEAHFLDDLDSQKSALNVPSRHAPGGAVATFGEIISLHQKSA